MRNIKASETSIQNVALVVNEIIDNIRWIIPMDDTFGKAEPAARYKKDGRLAYADGVNWNPNSTGKGLYYYNSTTSLWVKVG